MGLTRALGLHMSGLRALRASEKVRITKAEINLDLPPKSRWTALVKQSPEGFMEFALLGKAAKDALGPEAGVWLQNARVPKDYMQELEGIVAALNMSADTVDYFVLATMNYDMDTYGHGSADSVQGCSDILAAMPNGTVLHGRNLDFEHERGTEQKNMWEITFTRKGKPLYMSIQNLGLMGIHTGMRFDGWSLAQNTRRPGMSPEANLEGARRGGISAFANLRMIMETTPDYGSAVARLASTKWIAPQYFIVAGTGPYEGAVLTIDVPPADGSEPVATVETLNPYTRWFLLQANDDRWAEDTEQMSMKDDVRFSTASSLTAQLSQESVSEETLRAIMQTVPILNADNIFYWFATPQLNTWHTIFPTPP